MPGILAVVRVGCERRVLGTVSWAARDDASVYLRPIGASTAVYDYGFGEIPAGDRSTTFKTSGQLQANERPHVSIHKSGRCHVRAGRDPTDLIAGAEIGPLNAYTGEHIGTLFTSDVRSLARFDDVWPDVGARDADSDPWDISPSAGLDSGSCRVAVFVSRNPQNPRSSIFREDRLRRSDGGVLFVALNVFTKASLGDAAVGVIGGWDPNTAQDVTEAGRLVYVRDTIGA